MKGINFIEPLFHAVIDGRKTQTRRVMKPQPIIPRLGDVLEDLKFLKRVIPPNFSKPRYKVGETVYLKEPYYKHPCFETEYKYGFKCCGAFNIEAWQNKQSMPAKYARYFIEITDVRCERLQDISDEDCKKEGCFLGNVTGCSNPYIWKHNGLEKYGLPIRYFTYKEAYAALINSIKKGTWESNPYVWVYDFKLVENK
jgi:hypothetical protein